MGHPGDRANRLNALADCVAQPHCRLDVAFDIDVVGDERLHDRQLRRWQQHPSQSTSAADVKREIRPRIGTALDGSVPQSDVVAALVGGTKNEIDYPDRGGDRRIAFWRRAFNLFDALRLRHLFAKWTVVVLAQA